MAAKTQVGFLIVFATAVTVWTFDARLTTNPSTLNKHLNIPAGKPFEITCKVDSVDDRDFSYFKWLGPEGETLARGRFGVQEIGTNALKLTFNAPKTSDSGVYKCVALHDKKLSIETEVTITFFSRESAFERDYESVAAKEGSKLEVLCTATSELPLTYTWHNEHGGQIPFNSDFPIFVSSSEKGSSLNIKAVKITDRGIYTCTAKNTFGFASKLFQLTVFPISDNDTDDPSFIKNVQSVKITANSITFSILTAGSDQSIAVIYSEKQNSTEYNKEWKKGDIYEINDLIPGGSYKFQFRTIPSSSTWSKVYEVTLLPDVPEVILRSLEGNSLRLEWFRTLDTNLRGTIDKYTLTYYTLQINRGTDWIPSNCAITIELPSCVGYAYTISGLGSRVYYQIEFRAHTASGFGDPYKQKFYIP